MFIFPYSNSGWVLCSVFTSDSVTSFLLSYSRLGCRETAVSQLPTVGAYSIAQCSAWGSREGQVESYSKLRAILTHTHTSHDIEICRKHTGLNASITCTVYLCQIRLLTRITLWFFAARVFPSWLLQSLRETPLLHWPLFKEKKHTATFSAMKSGHARV